MSIQRCSQLSRLSILSVIATLGFLLDVSGAHSVLAKDDLQAGFQTPPPSARPWVYWFWLNGNITREGITADLEAMKRVGIGGGLIMEVDQGAPVGPIDFMSDKWRELFKHAVAEAERLGLEINMNNDAGWNGSGGPWIKPERSMQKIVFSETQAQGPRHFETTLPQPTAVAGYYHDIAVQAFPATGAYRIDNINAKALYQMGGIGPITAKALPPEMVIKPDRIVDLTSKMDKDGKLAWDVPEGNWTIVRFGHTSTGAVNAPAPKSGTGLDCDKCSTEGVEAQFAGMMAKLTADVGPAAGKALVTTHIDSWEIGAQNWTLLMREEFQKRRGYDLLSYLPVMMGRVVGSLEESERFLWDLRQTISYLIVENYAGRMQELAHEHGIKLSIEAYGGPTDDLPYAGRADEPMSEFWIGAFMYDNSKEMASAAHIYGKPILGAESFTATDSEKWREHPGSIKSLGDRAFCAGVNRFVFHRYAMQPWLDRKPGMTMGPWGLHYERTNTWWNDSAPWHEYLARCQYLLRQGRFVADLLYLQPEEAPQGLHSHPRTQYDFDNCSAEALLMRVVVRDGRLVLPDGMNYRVLVLPQTPRMTPRLLGKIADLVRAGATVVGTRPTASPSLSGYPACDQEVKKLADLLWADCDGGKVKEHRLGKGRMICGVPPEQVLAGAGVPPDFFNRSRLNYIHRSVGDTDIFFVANPEAIDVDAACAFRVTGKQPELWWPETGRTETPAMFQERNGVTEILLPLRPSGSVFVVFQPPTKASDAVVEVAREGERILSTGQSGPKIVLQKATYGVLDDPGRTRDVRSKVQEMLDAGEDHIRVAGLAENGDPAANVVKSLRLEYTIGQRHVTITGQDTDALQLTDDSHQIVIKSAIYGVPKDAKRTRDVTKKLQRMIDNGLREFTVAQMAAGDDPAYMVIKTLVAEYTLDGEPHKVTGTDSELIRLTTPAGMERIAEVRRSADGALLIEASKPGHYQLKQSGGKSVEIDVPEIPSPLEISGSWDVHFTAGGGAPEQITFDKLISWSAHSDPGVKYFSGSATYHKNFTVPAESIGKDRCLYLDLGKVQIMADVKLNGQALGLLWKPPYRVDISSVVKPGDNSLEVRVVNLWPNRMIGDELLPEDSERNANGTLKSWPQWVEEGKPSPTGRFTFTSWRLWKKADPLFESGLLGPVQITTTATRSVK